MLIALLKEEASSKKLQTSNRERMVLKHISITLTSGRTKASWSKAFMDGNLDGRCHMYHE